MDLFSGVGGFSLGFHFLSFNILGAIDIDKFACKTYEENFNNAYHQKTNIICKDMCDLPPESLNFRKNEIDLIIGGPPCQGFSIIGRPKIAHLIKTGKWRMKNIDSPRFIDDNRNKLYKIFVKYVSYFKPKFFIMENVPGLFSFENGIFKKQIIQDFKKINYETDAEILNAANYGFPNSRIRVPQLRKRAFFIGNRFEVRKKIDIPEIMEFLNKELKDPNVHQSKIEEKNPIIHISNPFTDLIFSPQTNKYNKMNKKLVQTDLFGNRIRPMDPSFVTVYEAISDIEFQKGETGGDCIEYFSPPKTDFQKWARNNSDSLHNHNPRKVTPQDFEIFKKMKEGTIYKELEEDEKRYGDGQTFPDKLRRMVYNKPSYTIIAHLSKDAYRYIHPINNRTISVREAARLQSFPDNFIFYGSRTQQFKQVGNAVPPLLAMAIAKAIRFKLEKVKWIFEKYSIPF